MVVMLAAEMACSTVVKLVHMMALNLVDSLAVRSEYVWAVYLVEMKVGQMVVYSDAWTVG